MSVYQDSLATCLTTFFLLLEDLLISYLRFYAATTLAILHDIAGGILSITIVLTAQFYLLKR